MKQTILTAASTLQGAIASVEKGLGWGDAEYLGAALGISLDRLAALAGIPHSTFFRRRGKRFPLAESEHLMRYARLWHVAGEVFPDEKAARSWLGRPQVGLDGAVPLEFAKTELGARTVEELLMRIHHGVLA